MKRNVRQLILPSPPRILLAAVLVACGAVTAFADLPRLKVSENQRFFVQEDGTPFFWLGDTAWELFHRLNREEADKYLENRAANGFTVIQAVTGRSRLTPTKRLSRRWCAVWPRAMAAGI
jgi:hypothetical protein